MEVEIVRSQKRKKTVGARLVKDRMLVYAPDGIPAVHLERIIHNFKRRFKQQRLKKELNTKEDLVVIAQRLNERYFKGKLEIAAIEYVTDQYKKFGCCSYKSKAIRISHRLIEMPPWVRDYVIFHEMAHIIEPNHSRAFWKIVSRYRLAERAKGYLMAKGFETERESDIENNNINRDSAYFYKRHTTLCPLSGK